MITRPLHFAVFALALTLAGPAVTAAQSRDDTVRARDGAGPRRGDHRPRGQHHGHRARMMRRALAQLDLTDNQKEQVRAIVETSRERARELRRQRTDEAREARHALRRETRRLIHDVLTPAQRDDLGRIMIEHHARKMERRIDHMTKRLQLSDEQVEQVRGIFEASRARAETLRESDLPRDEKRAQWRELKTDAREAVRSVLTAEQQAKLSELRERHGRRRGQGRR